MSDNNVRFDQEEQWERIILEGSKTFEEAMENVKQMVGFFEDKIGSKFSHVDTIHALVPAADGKDASHTVIVFFKSSEFPKDLLGYCTKSLDQEPDQYLLSKMFPKK